MFSNTDRNSIVERFQALDSNTIAGIADDTLRRQALKLKSRQDGFTLLELLVVVAILAVLGGLAIGAYGDKTSVAAKGGATNTLASTSSMVNTYQSTARQLPDDLDTLLCANPANADLTTGATSTAKYGGTSDAAGVGGGLGKDVGDKLIPTVIPDAGATALKDAGITRFRYGLLASCKDDGSNTGGTPAAAVDIDFGLGLNAAPAVAYPTGNLSLLDIPPRGFDFPQEGKNRGRGFVKSLIDNTGNASGNDLVLAIWDRGTGGINNVKIGAQAKDVLVAFGIGNNSTMFTDTSTRVAASPPFYGDVGKDKYNRYIALVKIGTATDNALNGFVASNKAAFITVVDSKGDFLDEEFAEANGQKS